MNAAADERTKLKDSEREAYRERLRGALIFRAKFNRLEKWRSYLQILGHNFYAGKTLDADSPTVNLLAARVRSVPPKLAFGVPSFDLHPYISPDNPNEVPATQAMLSMLWEQEAFDDVTRRITLDWPTFGLGIGFVGFEKGRDDVIIDSRRRLFGLLPESVTNKVSEATGGASDILTSREDRRLHVMLKERVFLERVSPFNFVIDPTADSWDDAQFMARRIAIPRERALLMFGKDTPKGRSANNVALYQSAGEDDPFGEKQDPDLESRLPDEVKRVMVWEMWDITTRRTLYLDDKGNVIGKQAYEWRSPHPGFPFVPLLWDEIPDMAYPEGLAAAVKPLNDELHTMRKRQLAEMRKAVRKYRVSPAASRDAKIALQSEEDGAFVEAEEGDIEAINHPALPPDMWEAENRVRRDIDEVTHTTAYDAGSMPQTKRTATEAAYSQSSSDSVAGWRKTAVERFAAQVAERMLAYLMTVFDEPINVRIANEDPHWVTVDKMGMPKDVPVGAMIDYPFIGVSISGVFRIKTVEDTMLSMAKDVERQQLAQAISMFAEAPWFKAREAAAHFFSTLPSVRDPYKFIMSDEEMAEQEAQAPAPDDPNAALPPGAPPGNPSQESPGSGNMTADMLAAMMGGQAPMTGDNGMGGAPDPLMGGM